MWVTGGGGTRSFACLNSVWNTTSPLDISAITAAAYLLSQISLAPLHHQVTQLCSMVERCRETPEVLGFRLGRAPLRRKTKVSLVPAAHFQGCHSPLMMLSLDEASSQRLRWCLWTGNISGEEEARDCSGGWRLTVSPESPLEGVTFRHCPRE